MKPFQLYTVILFVVLSLTSCSGEDKTTPITEMFFAESPAMLINGVSSKARDANFVSDDLKFSFVFDNDKRTATLWCYNLDLGDGLGRRECQFVDVPWHFSIGTPTVRRIIDEISLTSEDNAGTPITLNDFYLTYDEGNELDPSKCKGIFAMFSTGGRQFTAYPEKLYCEGTWVVKWNGGHEITYSPVMEIEFTSTGSMAQIAIDELPLQKDFENINFNFETNVELSKGAYRLISTDVVSVDSGVVMSDFLADGSLMDELTVSFHVLSLEHEYEIEAHLNSYYFNTPTVQSAL